MEAQVEVRYTASENPRLGDDEGWLAIVSAPLDARTESVTREIDDLRTPVLLRLPAGRYRFTVLLESYGRAQINADVVAGELCTVEILFAPAFTIISGQAAPIRWQGDETDQGGVVVPHGLVRITAAEGDGGVLEPVYPREPTARLLGALVPISVGVAAGLAIVESLLPVSTPTSVPLLTAGGATIAAAAIGFHIPLQKSRRRYIAEFMPPQPDYFAADAENHMAAAQTALAAGDTVAALERYSTVIQDYSNVPVVADALVARARLRFSRGDIRGARDDLETVIDRFPSPVTVDSAGLFLAEILWADGARDQLAMLGERLPMLAGTGTAQEFATLLE